ncbi:MAG: signal peptide peptidase SppA [Myxococcota bacterium]|nr:signal peptide peptidase SppA [Myxococcota bacterium]
MGFSRSPVLPCVALLLLASRFAVAQEEPPTDRQATLGVVLPSKSLTEDDDATALSTNPANLALLESWSFVYSGAYVRDQMALAGHGHGFFFAFPIKLLPLSLGVGIEALLPGELIERWQGMDDRARFSLAAAVHLQRAIALGVTYRALWGYRGGNVDSLDLSLSIRPVNMLALGVTMADVNTPVVIRETGERAPRRFDVGLTFRPLSNDRISLGAQIGYVIGKEMDRTDVYGLLNVMPWNGLSLRGRLGVLGVRNDDIDQSMLLDVSLAIDLSHFGVELGTHSQLTPGSQRGYLGTSWSLRLSGDAYPSLSFPRVLRARHFVSKKLDKAMDSVEFAQLADLLERARGEYGVDGVVLEVGRDSLTLAQALELRRRIAALRASDRIVLCHLVEATGPEYFACAAASEIWLDPAGGVHMAGISSRLLYFGDLLANLGVKADIVRIGEYKSATESYTRNSPSEAAAEQLNRYLDTTYEAVIGGLVTDRGLAGPDEARKLVEGGPYAASEARERGLVDALVPMDSLDRQLREYLHAPAFLDESYATETLKIRTYLDGPTVAVVHIEGDLVDGESSEIPLLGMKLPGAKTIVPILQSLATDRRVRSVVLRINSPGGSALASERIWRAVMSLRKSKPVIASMGSLAASGGYYIASAANEIYAESSTITGSIGIYYGKADLSGLMDRVGVDMVTLKRGEHADLASWHRGYTVEERELLQKQIAEYYELFLKRVVEGRRRGFTRDIVDSIGQGRVWSGVDAKYHLLVDEIGGYQEALERARTLGFVRKSMPVAHIPTIEPGLLNLLLGSLVKAAARGETDTHLMLDAMRVKQWLGAVYPLAIGSADTPRARLPFALEAATPVRR